MPTPTTAVTVQPSPAPVWAGTATPVADIVRPTDPEISQGWPLTAIPPSRQRFNWVLNRLSAGLRYIEQHGIGKWQVEEDYGEDSIVVHDHKLWVAKRANKGKVPPDNADDWDGIASMIAGPGGVDLTTIINQLIATDVTLNTVDIDLQAQIDALGGAIGDIPPPTDPYVPPTDSSGSDTVDGVPWSWWLSGASGVVMARAFIEIVGDGLQKSFSIPSISGKPISVMGSSVDFGHVLSDWSDGYAVGHYAEPGVVTICIRPLGAQASLGIFTIGVNVLISGHI